MSMQQLYIVTLSDSCKRGREGRGSSSTHGSYKRGREELQFYPWKAGAQTPFTDGQDIELHTFRVVMYPIQSYGILCSSISGVSKAHDHIHSESVESQGNEFRMQGIVSNECLTDTEADTEANTA